MKILLFGDYSSVHLNLKEGLEKLGHFVLSVGTGDGFKEIQSDINFNSFNSKFLNKFSVRIKPFLLLNKFKDFDVVQTISPYFLKSRFFPTSFYYDLLKRNNKKFFMLAVGSDAYYWKFGPKKLRYGPFEDILEFDIKEKNYPYYDSEESFNYNSKFSLSVRGIIPVLHDYEACYQPHPKLLSLIPIPINTDKIKYSQNKVSKKIIIFHGLNRYGFKGTKHVEKAFEILNEKYPNELELIIRGKMPLRDYLNLMNKTNIVIDQTSTYSLGVNGVYALAMGKVVFGGAEPESLRAMGVKKSPVINILPDANDIVRNVEKFIYDKKLIETIGVQSRKFAEENHDYMKVASKYIAAWNNS